MKKIWERSLCLIFMLALISATSACAYQNDISLATIISAPSGSVQLPPTITILLDDFAPQPYQGDTLYYFNRMDGDRGTLSDTIMDWGAGQVRMTIAPNSTWGGMWLSLDHPIREGVPIDFSAILPAPIRSKYQARITGLQVQVAQSTPGGTLKMELKNGEALQWMKPITLDGGEQTINIDLPALGKINHLVFVLDQGQAGNYVVIEKVSFTAKTQIKDTATAAFVWSYGMLLDNWDPETGLMRDKAREASGEFDAIQAAGSFAAASAVAYQLGIISRADAVQIVNRISGTLLNDIPRYHGLLPHWVKTSATGEYVIVENTEWSSVDTVITGLGLLEAQSGLGLDSAGAERLLKGVDWNNLMTENGISHGYTYEGNLIPYVWDVFGGESWLAQLTYASAAGKVAPLAYPSAPTANGSGFIDELAWMFVPPPSGKDVWGTNWTAYRKNTAKSQIEYYPAHLPESCFTKLGLFGLSAGEVPAPWLVTKNNIYQAYGVGGAFARPNDGSGLGAPVITPHYSAMIASLRPKETLKMWNWLIANGYFTPLNDVESLMFKNNSDCTASNTQWNQLKGSWNLSLQTLGWGRYLAEQDGKTPILWQAVKNDPFLKNGYSVLSTYKP